MDKYIIFYGTQNLGFNFEKLQLQYTSFCRAFVFCHEFTIYLALLHVYNSKLQFDVL